MMRLGDAVIVKRYAQDSDATLANGRRYVTVRLLRVEDVEQFTRLYAENRLSRAV